ncbi:MAG TPA: hypothetical protein PK733_11480 [Clostridiales bacterium]|nr:hypothetical protein [Clostridiales bacterium]
MGSIKIVKKEYKGWENCVELSNGLVDIIAVTDIGPRIIRFGFTGKENEFCEVADQVGTKGGDEWKIYGGHRLWHSPEHKPRSYEPDNSKINYYEKEDGIVLCQPVEQRALIKKEIEISLSPDEAKVTILHRLTNKGLWPIELAVWALTVMAPGGMEIIPQANRETDLLPNRMLSLWPYTKLNDPRVYWGEKYITLQQDSSINTPFKIGMSNEHGWAAYANHGNLFVKQYNHVLNAVYPDFGASSYETYTCDFMTEMESLSPMVTLEPDEYIEHTEVWTLFHGVKAPQNENEIDNLILPLIPDAKR